MNGYENLFMKMANKKILHLFLTSTLLILLSSALFASAPKSGLSSTDKVNGWILLDDNLKKTKATIDKAHKFGANHIQLSHGIIMNIDDVLKNDKKSAERIKIKNI